MLFLTTESAQRCLVLLCAPIAARSTVILQTADFTRLGVMLPYIPLHHLILAESGLTLVMTSGNMSDKPIAYTDTEAFERLNGIAEELSGRGVTVR